jgi:hypothetical protein
MSPGCVLICAFVLNLFLGAVVSSEDTASALRVAMVPGVAFPAVNADGSANNNSTVSSWSFGAIIAVPTISCDSVAKLPGLFDAVLRKANPGVERVVSSAVRFGDDVCVDSVCFCDEGGLDSSSPHSVRVLELSIVCDSPVLLSPIDAGFPFEFEMRSDLPIPRKAWNGRWAGS